MANSGRVVTANLSDSLLAKLDEVAARIDRSKSWIVRQALGEWLTEQDRRHRLTLEALKDVDEGRTFTQEQIEEYFEQRKHTRRAPSDGAAAGS